MTDSINGMRVRGRTGELLRSNKWVIAVELPIVVALCFYNLFPFSVNILLFLFASHSPQPFAPIFAAAGLSLLPAWGAARLAGGQPGGLTSSQPWHAGAAARHAPWGHGRGARRCWRVGHVKSGLFSLYSEDTFWPLVVRGGVRPLRAALMHATIKHEL